MSRNTTTVITRGTSSNNLRGRPSNGKNPRSVKGLAGAVAQSAILSYIDNALARQRSAKGFRTDPPRRSSKGEIVIAAPAALGRTITSMNPRTRSNNGVVTITHRELIEGSILGSAAFAVAASFCLQPGDKKTFPWLSIQATQYEQYRFKKLQFHYVPIVGTSVAGDVMLLADYNVQDMAPTKEVDALDHPRAKSGSLWDTHTFNCDISKLHALGPRKFIRSVAVAGDPKTYDCGNFHLCVNNSGVGTAVGKLFVEYEVDFYVPQLNPQDLTALRPSLTSEFYASASQNLVDTLYVPLTFLNANLYDPLRIYGSTETNFAPPAGMYRVSTTVTFTPSLSESIVYELYLYKDGVAFPTGAPLSRFIGTATTLTMTLDKLVPCTGTTVIQIVARVDSLTAAVSVSNKVVTFTLA